MDTEITHWRTGRRKLFSIIRAKSRSPHDPERWGALGLNPDASEGMVCPAVVELPSAECEIVLNSDAARSMRVEITDEHHHPLADFSGPNSGTLDTDGGLDSFVNWQQESLASLGGKKVRLRIHLRQQDKNVPRLFAIAVKSKV